MTDQTCPRCGHPREGAAPFCTSCGARFDEVPPPPPAAPPPYVGPPTAGRSTTKVVAAVLGGVAAVVLLIVGVLVLSGGGGDDEPAADDAVTTTTAAPATTTTTSTTTTSTSTTTTTTTVPPTTAPPTTAPPATAPPTTAPPTVDELPSGLYCRDLFARGVSYAEAVAYWYAEGMPDRMDADLDGIPCETVYPAADVEAVWGTYLPPPDDAMTAIALVEHEIYGCGYAPARGTWVEGPFADGLYLVHAYADVGYDVLTVAYEVSVYSGELIPVDQVSFEVFNCQA